MAAPENECIVKLEEYRIDPEHLENVAVEHCGKLLAFTEDTGEMAFDFPEADGGEANLNAFKRALQSYSPPVE